MSTLDRLARGSAMSLEELAAEVGDNGRRKRQRGLEEVAAEVGDKRRRIEAERVMKARQNAERMGRHVFRSQNDAKKARVWEAERESLNASTVWGNTRGGQKTADGAA